MRWGKYVNNIQEFKARSIRVTKREPFQFHKKLGRTQVTV